MIPVNTPVIGDKEKQLVNECLETGWISSEGPFIKKFEEDFSGYIGRKFGIAVSNGSAALDIAFKAIELKEGDEVIMPAFTIISPAYSVVRQGAIPVLVESDPSTWNMDVDRIEAKITKKTKAICIVHIYGLPVDLDPVMALARKYNLKVIEDAAEMHGQTYKGVKCGKFGDISIFSFYPNKHITTGEGGMLVTDDAVLADRISMLRNLSFDPRKRRFIHDDIGWNYRMTNLQAALGLGQLSRIDSIIARKREIGNLYSERLQGLKYVQLPLKKTAYAENIYWVYGLVTEDEAKAKDAVDVLTKEKIGTRPFFWCMHEQPYFQKMGLFKNQKYPVAEKMARNGFYIPSGLGLSNEEIGIVSETLIKIFR
jgi:perosamine synthetase